MDAEAFAALMKKTAVLSTKDDTRWDWKWIYVLFTGPLRDPQLLKQVAREFGADSGQHATL